jgi:hypothetical protein
MNIYNQSGNNSGSTNNIVSQNITAQNAYLDNVYIDQSLNLTGLSKGDILFIGNETGLVDGLEKGNNNDVLCSNGLIPEYRNSLVLQDLQINTLKINDTLEGDIIVIDDQSQIDRLPIGLSGTFLQSDGTNPSWSALPNPLILGSAVINNDLTLPAHPNSAIFTNNSGLVYSQQPRFKSGTGIINSTTPTVLYAAIEWLFYQNLWYKVDVQINTDNTNEYAGNILVRNINVGRIQQKKATFYCSFTYNHDQPTGDYGIELANFLSIGLDMTISWSIRVEVMATPIVL